MEKMKRIAFLAIVVAIVSCSDDDYQGDVPSTGETLKVLGSGVTEGQDKEVTVPSLGETITLNCFSMPITNVESGEVIGTLEDCTITSKENEDGTFTEYVITTFFIEGRGSIVAENIVTLTPTADPGFLNTSFIPTTDNIMDGTGDFENITGKVMLEGLIDVTRLETENIFVANCTFTIVMNP
ncbi:hypothetical protein [uncultured Aquimarina sp.]|uniref:hypothetical protein n=1 Tax=uncultured Aquimarina sp. TaxID=575652 RepID=UPI0026075107|nr:hypothetical protein [uncultured Aquimarina sp.]